MKRVFWVAMHSRYFGLLGQFRLSKPVFWIRPFQVLPVLLLLTTACAPPNRPKPADPSPLEYPPQELAFASRSFWTGFHAPESSHATAEPTSIRVDQIEETPPVHDGTPQSKHAVFSSPDGWKDMPIIPKVSPNVIQIFAKGISRGNNPHAFSKIGDCSTSNAWFLGPFDEGEAYYRLGEYNYLKPMIDHFKGSFARNNISTRNGFNAASVLSPLWADPDMCTPEETPLACEVRIHKPSIVFIMLGTNDRWHMETFEEDMREIIEFTLDHWIVPIIATKPDNFEGDESINRLLAQLAVEYEVPLWNFWAAIQPLPNAGLEEDGTHLTWGPTHFDDPDVMKLGWPMRNLTAMQALHAVWQSVYDSSVDETDVLR